MATAIFRLEGVYPGKRIHIIGKTLFFFRSNPCLSNPL